MPEPTQSGLSDNALGAIAYITVVPAIFFLAVEPYNKKPYVRFHAWQSIMLSVVAFILTYALRFFLPFTIPFGFLGFLTLNWVASFVGLAFFLVITFAIGYQQDLSCQVFMPVVSATGLKYDITYSITARLILRDQGIQPCRSSKVVSG